MNDVDIPRGLLFEQSDVFREAGEGYDAYRFPSITLGARDAVLAVCQGRTTAGGKVTRSDIVCKRSFDNGRNWGMLKVIAGNRRYNYHSPCIVCDAVRGAVWLFFAGTDGGDVSRVFCAFSCDGGETWTTPLECTDGRRLVYSTGNGAGIQTRNGTLIIPCAHRPAGDGLWAAQTMFSEDHGTAWKHGGVIAGLKDDRWQIVEREDGSLMGVVRTPESGRKCWSFIYSNDMGLSWTRPAPKPSLTGYGGNASILRVTQADLNGENGIMFSNPASIDSRRRMTVRMSYDGGDSWPVSALVYSSFSADSCLTVLGNGLLGCLYERNNYGSAFKGGYAKITLARFSLAWLSNGQDHLYKNRGGS